MDNNSIPITRPNSQSNNPDLSNQFIKPLNKIESKFPTEIYKLISKGWFYDANNPLSKGEVELLPATTKTEDLLSSQSLLKSGKVFDEVIKSLLVDKSINPEDILICDKNGLLMFIRQMMYGNTYNFTCKCPNCDKENKCETDLSKYEDIPYNFEQLERGKNEFTFELPFSKITVTYKLLSQKDDNAIDAELKKVGSSSGINKEMSTRLIYIITSINGNTDKNKIRLFVANELLAKDSLALRKDIRKNTPTTNNTFNFTCQFCGVEKEMEPVIAGSFFWPES